MAESDGVLPTNNQTHKKIKYIILGSGSIGYNVLEELKENDENVLVIDINEKRIEDLRDHRHQAMIGDMTDPTLITKIPEPEVAFVLSADKDANLAAVQILKKAYPQTHVIARALDPFSADQLVDHGADVVLYPQQVVAKSAVNHMNNLVASRNAQKLFSLLSSWTGTLGIITHKNPDPDAISSAMALAAIATSASGGKLATRILYEGNIGHQENRAFVNLLEIKMERLTPEIFSTCNYLALVDCVAPGMNNDLPPDAPINIIIDHHSAEGITRVKKPEFLDSRPNVGATASIMTQYLQELYLPIDKKVATALFYGIRADTKEFQRNISPQDLYNAAYLLPLTDRSLLEVIMAPSLSQETLDVLGNGIVNRDVRHGYLFSNVGYVRNRDAIPQAADMLLNLEGVTTAMVYGITDTNITLSARNKDIRLHVGDVMKEAFADIPGASAGGHATMAALSIPLNAFSLVKDKEELLSMVIDPVLSNFMRLVGISEVEGDEN
ncbi:DHH family phosphoesterase [Methanorbis rubei]|uniref:Manganese-dependent inorganic pyrophosphatase n=1 Tax=Methanorbis rubei TaxID=3028300 RepID=A0AAE4MG87_9EURY|nr:manganese-dependent inorganic pyrophosphatase [Methanocorpusculaceae archaeon Cs1]